MAAGMRGSHAHGTFIPPEHEHGTDDTDVWVITVQTPGHYASLQPNRFECFETAGEDLDILVYDARKWFGLLLKQNPNAHAWLWTDQIFATSDEWEMVESIRGRLISKQMFKHLIGYATGQLRMMSRGAPHGYMGEKRKALLTRYGYDIKNAAHCVRLLHIARHLGDTGELLVRLPKAELEEIKLVKSGQVALRDLIDRVAELRILAANAERASQLPAEIPVDAFERLWGMVLNDV